MEIEVLVEQNKWWKKKDSIEEDYDILKWKKGKYRWIPEVLNDIMLKPFSLHIILGPRQVGKTTAIKLMIKKMLDDKDPRSLFYFNCDEISDHRELKDVLETYLYLKGKWKIKTSYIFLDEITSPREWYRTIKSMIDLGKFRNDVVVLTGSSSISIKGETELFPGRRGHGKNFIFLPLSFREYLKIHNPEVYKKIRPVKNLKVEDFEERVSEAMLYKKELDIILKKYFTTGGFPLSIEIENLADAKNTYLNWIKTDILKSNRSDTIARQIIKSFIGKLSTPISWEKISREIEVKSPKTVAAYIELLRSLFSVIVLHHVDITPDTIKVGKNKKIHVIDPLLLAIFEDWCMVKLKEKEHITAESLVATHLARFLTIKYGFSALDEQIFYWRNKSEIDVIVNDRGLKGFEVKWTDKFDIKTHPGLKTFMVVSKNKFNTKPLSIPLSVFLSLLDI